MADEFLIKHACLACSPPHIYHCADCSTHPSGSTACPDARVYRPKPSGPIAVRARRGGKDERISRILRKLR